MSEKIDLVSSNFHSIQQLVSSLYSQNVKSGMTRSRAAIAASDKVAEIITPATTGQELDKWLGRQRLNATQPPAQPALPPLQAQRQGEPTYRQIAQIAPVTASRANHGKWVGFRDDAIKNLVIDGNGASFEFTSNAELKRAQSILSGEQVKLIAKGKWKFVTHTAPEDDRVLNIWKVSIEK